MSDEVTNFRHPAHVQNLDLVPGRGIVVLSPSAAEALDVKGEDNG